ncbi:hypothetical protein BN871_BS_00360 [Paenibacillus sp. P22]|nr:hypothetical protein BN871_BS_00360 [Paenibacillus sp. P22]
MVHAGLADRALQHLADFLEVHVGMQKTDFRHLSKLLGQVLQSHLLLQQTDIVDLAHGSSDRLVEVGRLAVDDAVDGVPHVAHDADILEFEQSLMSADDVQQLDDLLAFLDVEDESFLALDAPGVQPEFVGQRHQCPAMLLVHAGNLQMIGGAFGVVDGAAGQESAAQVSALAARTFDHILIYALIEHESFGNDVQILENFLDLGRNPDNVDIVLLQPHLLADKQLGMDVEYLLDQAVDPARDGRILRRDVEDDLAAGQVHRSVHPDQSGQLRPFAAGVLVVYERQFFFGLGRKAHLFTPFFASSSLQADRYDGSTARHHAANKCGTAPGGLR